MPLSPEEISNRDFLVALRGYDKAEVEAFLRDVASQYADLMAEVVRAREEASTGSVPAADPFLDLGDHVASLMRTASEAAAQLRTEAEQEATSIRTGAQEEAAHAAAEARLELDAASELRAQAEREAAQLRAAAREEVARIRNEAGQMLDAARETRATVEREAKELRESAARHEQELRARAEQTVAQLVASAKQEIGEAMRQVLGGSERLQRVEQRPLSFGATVPPGSGEIVESPLAPASGPYQRPDEDAAAS